MKLTPKHRGIPTKWIHEGVPAGAIPLTGFAYHSWQQFHNRIVMSPNPMATLFDICEEHFAAPEQGYLWIAALLPSPLRYNLANRVLGCGLTYSKRNLLARRRTCELAGITKEEAINMPWNYVVPKTTRSIQFARRETMTDMKDYNQSTVVEYLVALRERNPEYLEKIEHACGAVIEDAIRHGHPLDSKGCITLRLFIVISYMCAARPSDLTYDITMSDDPESSCLYWSIAIRSNDHFYIINGTHY